MVRRHGGAFADADAVAVELPKDRCRNPHAQQRLWYLDQLEPNTAVYNMSTVLRLRGELDVNALRQALNEIVCRHDGVTHHAGDRRVRRGYSGSTGRLSS